MGGRGSLDRLLGYGVRQLRFQVYSKLTVEFSPDAVCRESNRSARIVGQASSGRNSLFSCIQRSTGIHGARSVEYAVEPTYGVGPVMGGEQDPKTKGDTPDDFRALDMHAAEPKEITKEAAAKAMQEPPDFQVKKAIPEESKPVEGDAHPQRADQGKAFEENPRKQEGTAQYQGDTTGTEKSGHEVEGQYGAGPDDGKTTRA